MIAIEGFGFRFRDSDRETLHDVTLVVEPGEFLLVTGPSGCGKSVLALAIGGYLFRQYDVDARGTVTVAGMDVRQRPVYDIAEAVGLVQQNPEAQFCTLTVRDEVAFGLENRCLPRDEIGDRLTWALSIVGAEHLEERSLATLSGGEKQKVAIAAMMATKPQVLILDEPTSNLDPTATLEMFQVIEHIRAKAGMTIIVIEHKLDYLRRFHPRLVSMDDGRIVYDGPMLDTAHHGPAAIPARAPESAADRPAIPGWPRNDPLIIVEDLHAGYDERAVLDGISLSVHAGDFVSVMGDNGSGKTTFLQCLLGLLKPSGGRVLVMGQDTRRVPVSRLARQVGYVFQNPDHQLFADSVWEEAVFALRQLAGRGALDEAQMARVRELLARCDLGDRLDEHPYRLSYGQKRRLNLVSVLSYDPRIILLDEMLIGQDPANAAFLLDLLRGCTARGAAVILVNHAPELTGRYANRLLFFDSGQIVVDAPTEEGFAQLASLGRTAYVP